MENAVVSPSNLFWNKLGKWQLLAVIMTLVTFFITLHFTGDKEKAALVAAFVAALAAAFVAAFAAALAAAFAAFAAAFAAFAAFAAAFAAFAAAFAAAFVVTDELGKYGIRKKVIWFSFAAEFVVIFLPILLTR